VKFDGHGGPIDETTLASTPFEGTLQLDQVALSGAQQYTASQALAGMEALIGGNLKFKNDAGKVAVTGTVRMDNVVAHGKPLGFPIELNYNATDDMKNESIDIRNTQLKVGGSTFVINGTVNGKSTPALADLKLNTQNASVADLVKLAEAGGAKLSQGTQPSGQLTADLTAKGPLSGPAVAGTLNVAKLAVSGLVANAVQVTLNMAPPGAELIPTLTGRITLNMTDGKLTGVDLSQKLGEIGKFTGGKSSSGTSDGTTHVSQLSGTFDLKNGVATTNDLKALTDAGTVAATGSASLVDQGLDMKATAVLSKSSSQQVGGSGVGGMMTTTMANNNGELVIPVLVTGTIPSPKVAPDVSAMAKMRLNNALPSFSNPGQLTQGALSKAGGGVGGMLGGVTGKSTPGAAASNQQNNNSSQSPASALGGLFGKKKQ
jgi:uncharacterized protein YhdP